MYTVPKLSVGHQKILGYTTSAETRTATGRAVSLYNRNSKTGIRTKRVWGDDGMTWKATDALQAARGLFVVKRLYRPYECTHNVRVYIYKERG